MKTSQDIAREVGAIFTESVDLVCFPYPLLDAFAVAIIADRAQRQAGQELADYAEARVQADRTARRAEQGPCGWMQNIDKAMQEPLFQALRGIMGTENMGQDMALLQTIRHYRAKTPSEAHRQAEQEGAEQSLGLYAVQAWAIRDEAKAATVRLNLHNLELRHAGAQAMCNSQQAEIAALRQKISENELMAECTVMLRDDLIEAGIIDKTVPPMMLTEAILRYASALRKDAERLDFIQKNRIGLLPQMFADWDAEGYDGEGDPTVIASGNSLRGLIDRAMAQAVQPSDGPLTDEDTKRKALWAQVKFEHESPDQAVQP